ncbi:SDR family oxidoreductase [Streptomyces bobili]|uniref:SDR family oxidoreductase n=1 Tax=Streptomyces bobili TaxID=67280 RepID=UPI003798216C
MKVVVWDDGGLIGVETALWVRDHGHEVALLSAPHGLDSYTREEITEVLRDCSVVIDLLCRPSLAIGTLTEDQGFVIDEEALVGSWLRSTRKLLQAETAAGVTYHVALSVTGVDRAASSGVFRALKARESMIQRSATPHFILRSTQMFESAEEIATAGTEDWIVWVPPVDVRPVALTDVAMLLAHTAVSRPRTGVHEIAGPETIGLDTFVRAALAANAEYRRVFTDVRSPFFGTRLGPSDLLPDANAFIAQTSYREWFAARPSPGINS